MLGARPQALDSRGSARWRPWTMSTALEPCFGSTGRQRRKRTWPSGAGLLPEYYGPGTWRGASPTRTRSRDCLTRSNWVAGTCSIANGKAAVATAGALSIARTGRPHLPTPLTSFIGREREVARLRELVASARLVTVLGLGGVGKTPCTTGRRATA